MRSRSYRETFRKHRLLYSLPVLIGVLAAAALSFTSPKTYVSSASLWVDNNAGSSISSLDVGPTDVQAVQPSTAEQTVLNELLATTTFDRAVVAGSGVAPGSAAASALAQTVRTGVTSTVPGPQVLAISFTGSSPLLAQRVVGSVLQQLQRSMNQFSRNFGDAAIVYDRTQEQSAAQAVSDAKAAVNSYRVAHPSATVQNDQTYASYVAALADATSSLNSAVVTLNEARAEADGSGAGVTVSVYDEPSFNAAPTSGMKSMAMKVVGGAFAGLLISLLLIMALTPQPADEWDAEIVDGGGRGPMRPATDMAGPRLAPTPEQEQTGIVSPQRRRALAVRTVAHGPEHRAEPGPAAGPRGRHNRAWGISDQQTREERA